MDEETPQLNSSAQRRIAAALVTSVLFGVAGRFAVLFWGQWVAIPFAFGFFVIVFVTARLEARARKQTVSELIKEMMRRGQNPSS